MQRLSSSDKYDDKFDVTNNYAASRISDAGSEASVEDVLADPSSSLYLEALAHLTSIQSSLRSAAVAKARPTQTLSNKAPTRVYQDVRSPYQTDDSETKRYMRQLSAALLKVRLQRRRKMIFAAVFLGIYTVTLFNSSHLFGGMWWIFAYIGGNSVMDGRSINAAVESLLKSNEPRACGVLAQTYLEFRDTRMKYITRRALLTLLPQTKSSDAKYFDKAQRNAIVNIVDKGDWELKLAALKCLEQTGDTSAVWVVEQAAQYDRSSVVRRAAAECLPILMEHIRATTEAATLLRASSTSAIHTDQLLRTPVTNLSDTETNVLLRPNEPTIEL